MRLRLIFALLFVSIIPAGIAVGETDPAMDGLFDVEMRVALEMAAVKAEVDGNGANLVVTSAENGARLNIGEQGKILAEWSASGLKINHQIFPVHSARVESRTGIILLNGKKYRGYLLLWNGQNGTLDVVNHVPLESYVRSVVAMEIPKSWHMEAQKAQAVAARTYALYKRQENSGNLFDVAQDVSDQVYGGVEVENDAADKAVKDTVGLTLVYENRLALTYFHSNSGGSTEDAAEAFHGAKIPYLKGVTCRYSSASPYYVWQLNLKLPEIESALSRNSVFSGKINDVSVQSRTQTGRVRQVKISGRNKTELLDAAVLRRVLGGTRFKSTRFSVRKSGQTLTFFGNGYGHGVGLCQWGAKGMADHKSNFKEILSHYYPGTQISSNFLISSME
jgi:stage II sporulation protein D